MNLTQEQIIQNPSDDKGRTYMVKIVNSAGFNEELVVPSVTTIINYVVNKPALTTWAYNTGVKSSYHVLGEQKELIANEGFLKLRIDELKMTHIDAMQEGRRRGIEIHSVLEAIIKGEEFTYPTQDKPYVTSLMKFIEDYDPEWHCSEMKVASLEDEFAGTLDTVCTIRKHPSRRKHINLVGKKVLVDVKTNSEGRVYPESHFPQVEAYEKAYLEMGHEPVDYCMVVGIGPDQGDDKKKFSPSVSYYRYRSFQLIKDLYDEYTWGANNNPNRRKEH